MDKIFCVSSVSEIPCPKVTDQHFGYKMELKTTYSPCNFDIKCAPFLFYIYVENSHCFGSKCLDGSSLYNYAVIRVNEDKNEIEVYTKCAIKPDDLDPYTINQAMVIIKEFYKDYKYKDFIEYKITELKKNLANFELEIERRGREHRKRRQREVPDQIQRQFLEPQENLFQQLEPQENLVRELEPQENLVRPLILENEQFVNDNVLEAVNKQIFPIESQEDFQEVSLVEPAKTTLFAQTMKSQKEIQSQYCLNKSEQVIKKSKDSKKNKIDREEEMAKNRKKSIYNREQKTDLSEIFQIF